MRQGHAALMLDDPIGPFGVRLASSAGKYARGVNYMRIGRCRERVAIARYSLLALALLLVSSCTSNAAPVIATYPPDEGTADVLLEGNLAIHQDCIMLRTESAAPDFIMLLWPDGFSVDQEDNQTSVLDESGHPVGRVGGSISLGGGPIGQEAARKAAGDSLPSECVVKHIFKVATP